MGNDKGKGHNIQSITKAIHIIELLEKNGHAMSLTDISVKMGWPKSTVHGIVSTLVHHSILEQSSVDGRYLLGIRLFELGCSVSNSWNITTIARPFLERLALSTGETSFLSVISGTETILLDSVESTNNLKVVSKLGSRAPVYVNSQGKVLLAYQNKTIYNQILKNLAFTKFTPHTTVSETELRRCCEQIRKDGYYIEKGEYRMGLCSAAAPVLNISGDVRYAVGIVGMFPDVHSQSFAENVKLVCRIADEISQEMGYYNN